MASLTRFSRVEAEKHFPSDVLAGAAIGMFLATVVDALHFGDGSPGRGICGSPASFEVGTTEDGRPEFRISFGL